MKKQFLLLLGILSFSGVAVYGQVGGAVRESRVNPNGTACTVNVSPTLSFQGSLYYCSGGTYAAGSGGAGGGNGYNVTDYGATGDGTTDDRAALNTLVNTTITAGGDVYFPHGTYSIQSAMTFPATVRLVFEKGATLKPANGVTVTILSVVDMPAQQIFTNANASQGTINFEGNLTLQAVYPEWWGAFPATAPSSTTAPVQAAIIGAFGSGNRTNASGLFIYNRALKLSGMYRINDTLQLSHIQGGVIEGIQQMGCGFMMETTDKTTWNVRSMTRTRIRRVRFETNSSQGNGVASIILDYVTGVDTSDLKIQNIRFEDCFFIGSGVAKIGVWISPTPGSQGDNVSFEDCYAQGYTYAAGVIGGNNTGPLVISGTTTGYSYNALHINWKRGDIQSCKNGLLAYGGNWVVEGTTFENQSAQTFGGADVLADGVDVYCEASIRGCVLRDILTESYRITGGDGDIIMENVRQQGTPYYWYVAGQFDSAGQNFNVGQMLTGSAVGGDGKMWEVTSKTGDGIMGGLSLNTATGGSTTTITKTGAGWTVNAYNGFRVSILGGTGKYLYGIASSNTSDTITVASWLTKYHDITDTAPDNTSTFVVEPNWGTQTTITTATGSVTVTERDFYVISGLASGGRSNVRINGFNQSHLGKVSAKGEFRNMNMVRADWFQPTANDFILDDTTVKQVFENIYVIEGAAGSLYKNLKWQVPRNRSNPDKYVAQNQLGTKSLVWSAGGTGGGVSATDLVIERGDQAAHNDTNTESRNVFNIQGTLGRKLPVGTNQAGLSLYAQTGLSTGTGVPGKFYLGTGSVGSSGATANPSDFTKAAYFDYLGFRALSYTFATLPSSTAGQILYCSDCTPTSTLAGSSTGANVQRLNGAWTRVVNAEGGGGDALTANPLSQFAATNSGQLAGVISDETGSGLAVFATSPTFTTQITTPKVVWTGSVQDLSGSGTPEGAVTAAAGSVYRNTAGGASTTVYAKESGSGNTGWVAIGAGGGGTPGGSSTQVQYNNAGAFGGITNATTDGTTMTLTSPKVVTGINDTNGNELIKVTATTSAVNEITVANAAAGANPTITSSGDDAAIGVTFALKGSGQFIVNGAASTNFLRFQQAGTDVGGFSASQGFLGVNSRGYNVYDGGSLASPGNWLLKVGALSTSANISLNTTGLVSWNSSASRSGDDDVGIARAAAAVLRLSAGCTATGSATGAGSLIIGTSAGAIGTSGAGVLAFALSTAPTTSPADTVQLYSNDYAAGDHRLFLRSESGSPQIFGNNAIGQSPASGTDTAGTTLAVIAGQETGNGASGSVKLQTSVVTSTGTTVQSLVDRVIVNGAEKALTDATATGLFEVALPTLTGAGGKLHVTIKARDGTDEQTLVATVRWLAVNKGGTKTTQITVESEGAVASVGTLTATWDILDGTDKVTIRVTADTSLTPTTFVATYVVENNSRQGITLL